MIDKHREHKDNIPVGEMILKALRESPEPVSTYELAKKLGISWSTANTHCYKLKDAGKVDNKEIVQKIGAGKKVVWFMKDYDALAKFAK